MWPSLSMWLRHRALPHPPGTATRREQRHGGRRTSAPPPAKARARPPPPPRRPAPSPPRINERTRSAARCSRRAARRAYFLLCPKDSSNMCIAVARFLPPYLDFFWDKPVNPDLYDSCRRRRGIISGGGASGSGRVGAGTGATPGRPKPQASGADQRC